MEVPQAHAGMMESTSFLYVVTMMLPIEGAPRSSRLTQRTLVEFDVIRLNMPIRYACSPYLGKVPHFSVELLPLLLPIILCQTANLSQLTQKEESAFDRFRRRHLDYLHHHHMTLYQHGSVFSLSKTSLQHSQSL